MNAKQRRTMRRKPPRLVDRWYAPQTIRMSMVSEVIEQIARMQRMMNIFESGAHPLMRKITKDDFGS